MARPKSGYRLANGQPVPGVTTVIKTLSESEGLIHWAWGLGKKGVDYRAVRQKAADVGTLTHDLIEAHLRGTTPPTCKDKDMLAKAVRAFDSWQSWFDGQDIRVQAFERPLVSEAHGFGGTIDATGLSYDSTFLLVDWKTSKRLYAEYLAQIGGYAILLAENEIAQPKGAVLMRADKEKDMTWDVLRLDHSQLRSAGNAFLSALSAYKARERMKSLLNTLEK